MSEGRPWAEYQQLLRGLDPSTPLGRRDAALITAVGEQGLRLEEAVGLRIGDVDLANNTVSVEIAKLSQRRTLPLSPVFREAWLDHVRTMSVSLGSPEVTPGPGSAISEYFAFTSENGRPLFLVKQTPQGPQIKADSATAGGIMKKVQKRAGTKGFSFRVLRATFGRMMRRGLQAHPRFGVSEKGAREDVGDILGHRAETTSGRHYTRLGSDEIVERFEAVHAHRAEAAPNPRLLIGGSEAPPAYRARANRPLGPGTFTFGPGTEQLPGVVGAGKATYTRQTPESMLEAHRNLFAEIASEKETERVGRALRREQARGARGAELAGIRGEVQALRQELGGRRAAQPALFQGPPAELPAGGFAQAEQATLPAGWEQQGRLAVPTRTRAVRPSALPPAEVAQIPPETLAVAQQGAMLGPPPAAITAPARRGTVVPPETPPQPGDPVRFGKGKAKTGTFVGLDPVRPGRVRISTPKGAVSVAAETVALDRFAAVPIVDRPLGILPGAQGAPAAAAAEAARAAGPGIAGGPGAVTRPFAALGAVEPAFAAQLAEQLGAGIAGGPGTTLGPFGPYARPRGRMPTARTLGAVAVGRTGAERITRAVQNKINARRSILSSIVEAEGWEGVSRTPSLQGAVAKLNNEIAGGQTRFARLMNGRGISSITPEVLADPQLGPTVRNIAVERASLSPRYVKGTGWISKAVRVGRMGQISEAGVAVPAQLGKFARTVGKVGRVAGPLGTVAWLGGWGLAQATPEQAEERAEIAARHGGWASAGEALSDLIGEDLVVYNRNSGRLNYHLEEGLPFGGAVAGAAIGTAIFPVVGTIVGGLVGLGAGLLGRKAAKGVTGRGVTKKPPPSEAVPTGAEQAALDLETRKGMALWLSQYLRPYAAQIGASGREAARLMDLGLPVYDESGRMTGREAIPPEFRALSSQFAYGPHGMDPLSQQLSASMMAAPFAWASSFSPQSIAAGSPYPYFSPTGQVVEGPPGVSQGVGPLGLDPEILRQLGIEL